jgi:hypothetical protein
VCTITLTLAAAIRLLFFAAAEPRYEGKTLSEWLQLAEQRSRPHNTAAVLRAEAAVRNIGARAVPALLRMFTAEDGLRYRLGRTWNRTVNAVAPPVWAWRLQMDDGESRVAKNRLLAHRGFEILAADADPAVSQLKPLLHLTNWASDTVIILADINTSNALAALATGLTNTHSKVRLAAIASLAFDWESHDFGPLNDKICNLLCDRDDEVAAYALKTLINSSAEEEAPSMAVVYLKDSRILVQRQAIHALFFGPEWAMNSITHCFSSPDLKNRRLATNAILSINPYRAPALGVNTNGVMEHVFTWYDRRKSEMAQQKRF